MFQKNSGFLLRSLKNILKDWAKINKLSLKVLFFIIFIVLFVLKQRFRLNKIKITSNKIKRSKLMK